MLRVIKIILYAAAGLLGGVILVALGFVSLLHTSIGGQITGAIASRVARNLSGAQVSLGSLMINVFDRSVFLKEFSLSDGKGPSVLELGSLKVRLNPLKLAANKLSVDSVELDGLTSTLVIKDGKVQNLPVFKEMKSGGGGGPDVEINKLSLTNGRVVLDAPGAANADIDGIEATAAKNGDGYDVALKTRLFDVATPAGVDKDCLLSLDATVSTKELRIRELNASIGAEWYVRANGVVKDLKTPFIDAAVTMKIPIDLARQVVPGFPKSEGIVSLDARASGVFPAIEGMGSLKVTGAKVGQFSIGDVKADVDYAKQLLVIQDMSMKNAGIDLSLNAEIELAGKFPIEANVTLRQVMLHRLLDNLNAHNNSHVEFDASGYVHVSGHFAGEPSFRMKPKLVVRDLRVLEDSWRKQGLRPVLHLRESRVNVDMDLDAKGILVRTGQVFVEGSTLSIDGTRFAFSEAGGMDLTAVTGSFELRTVSPLAGFSISGRGPVRARIHGPYPRIRIDGHVNAENAMFAGFHGGRAEMDVSFASEVLSFEEIKGVKGGMAYTGDCTLDFRDKLVITASLNTEGAPLSDVLGVFGNRFLDAAEAKGTVSVNASIDGPPNAFSGAIKAAGTGVEFHGQRLDSFEAGFSGAEGSLTIDKLELRRGAGIVKIAGTISRSGAMNLAMRADGVKLSDISVVRLGGYPLDGVVDMWAAVGGTVRDPVVDSGVNLRDASIGKRAILPSFGDVKIEHARLSANLNLMGGMATLEGWLMLRGRMEYEVRSAFKGFEWPQLIPGSESVKGSLDAGLTLSGSLSALGDVSGAVDLRSFTVDTERYSLKLAEKGTITLERGVISMTPLGFSGNGLEMKLRAASGGSGIRGGVAAQGKASLKLLELVAANTLKAEGDADFNLLFTGTIANPDVTGRIELDRGQIEFTSFPHPLERLSFKAVVDGKDIRFEEIRAEIGGGSMEGTGTMELKAFIPYRYGMSAVVRGANLKVPDYLPSRVSGRIRLEGDRLSMLLSGDITIEEMTYSENMTIDKLLMELQRRKYNVSTFERGKEFLRFDIGMKGDSNILVKNGVIDAEFKADLRLTGSTQRLGLMGAVTGLKGKMLLLSNEFILKTATLQFKDQYRIAYNVDIRAETVCHDQVSGLDHPIKLQATGGDGDIRITYEDLYQPPFNQTDVIMCLTMGTSSAQLSKTKDAGLGLISSVSGLESTIRSVVPIETFRISQMYSETARTTVPTVQVTWKLLYELRLSFTSSLVSNTDQLLEAEYKLDRVVSVHAEAGRSTQIQIGDLGLDLKLKWEF